MFIEPTITWVPSGFSGYIWLDTKIVLKKKKKGNILIRMKKIEVIAQVHTFGMSTAR